MTSNRIGSRGAGSSEGLDLADKLPPVGDLANYDDAVALPGCPDGANARHHAPTGCRDRLWRPIGTLDEPDPANLLSGFNSIARINQRFEEACLRCQHIVGGVEGTQYQRFGQAERSPRLDRSRQDLEVPKDVAQPAGGESVDARCDVAPASHLGGHYGLALPFSLARKQPGAGDIDVEKVVVGVPGEHGFGHFAALFGIR